MAHFVTFIQISSFQTIDSFNTAIIRNTNQTLKITLDLGISSGVTYIRGYVLRID